jgi:hypothetical protein
MRLSTVLQFGWAFLLFDILAVPVLVSQKNIQNPWVVGTIIFTTVFFISSIMSLLKVRRALVVAFVCNLLTLTVFGAYVGINVLMFLIGHELYQDFPATIIVVFIHAIILVLPPAIVTNLLWRDREFIFSRLPQPEPADSNVVS